MRIIHENGKYVIIPESIEEADQINSCILLVYKSGEVETRFTPDNSRSIMLVFANIDDVQHFSTIFYNFQQKIYRLRIMTRLSRIGLYILANSLEYRCIKIYDLIIKLFREYKLLQKSQQIYELIIESAGNYSQPTQT